MQDLESAVAMTLQTQIKAIERTLSTMEKSSTGSSSTTAPSGTLTRGYFPEKNTISRTLEGELDQWRAWRDDAADFLDTRNVGMFKFLHTIAMKRDTLTDSTMKRKWAALGQKSFGRPTCKWRALRGLTGGVARSVVQSVHGEDDFEAWRQLHLRFEPKLMVRQEQVLADFAAMVTRPAETVNEARELTVEMDRKLKEIRDVTEENVSDIHAKSVLIWFLDPMTKQRQSWASGSMPSEPVLLPPSILHTAAGRRTKHPSLK